MAVVDADDRLLLARGPQWAEARFSVLAGFVEPGESLEAAVAREVPRRSGVAVEDVRYLGNQPWPFPSSLMLGFTATRQGHELPAATSDEIVEARWFTREELAASVVDDGRIGDVRRGSRSPGGSSSTGTAARSTSGSSGPPRTGRPSRRADA